MSLEKLLSKTIQDFNNFKFRMNNRVLLKISRRKKSKTLKENVVDSVTSKQKFGKSAILHGHQPSKPASSMPSNHNRSPRHKLIVKLKNGAKTIKHSNHQYDDSAAALSYIPELENTNRVEACSNDTSEAKKGSSTSSDLLIKSCINPTCATNDESIGSVSLPDCNQSESNPISKEIAQEVQLVHNTSKYAAVEIMVSKRLGKDYCRKFNDLMLTTQGSSCTYAHPDVVPENVCEFSAFNDNFQTPSELVYNQSKILQSATKSKLNFDSCGALLLLPGLTHSEYSEKFCTTEYRQTYICSSPDFKTALDHADPFMHGKSKNELSEWREVCVSHGMTIYPPSGKMKSKLHGIKPRAGSTRPIT